MTYCKCSYLLMHEDGPEYETTYRAETAAPFSGIHYCEACGGSFTSLRSQYLPSQDHHHPHTPSQGPGRWRLAVKSHYGQLANILPL
jgi:hypothetical protein